MRRIASTRRKSTPQSTSSSGKRTGSTRSTETRTTAELRLGRDPLQSR
jgi:hypothetical protein